MSGQSFEEISDEFDKLSVVSPKHDQSPEESPEKISDESSQLPGESASQFQKICVVATHLHGEIGDVGYAIYIIDVSNSSASTSIIQPLEQIFDLDYFEFPDAAIAVLGTTLYVFGGQRVERIRKSPSVSRRACPYWKSDVYSYDMKDAISSSSSSKKTKSRRRKRGRKHNPAAKTTKLQTSCLFKEENMWGRKHYPVAVVIDDYRICVFGLKVFDHSRPFSLPNFELFDTRTRAWTVLPELMDYSSKLFDNRGYGVAILSYYTGHSTLIVSTTVGFFCMNFDRPDPQWEQILVGNPSIKRFPYCSGISGMIIGDLLCTPFEVLKWGDFHKKYPIEFKTNKEREALKVHSRKSALCVEGRDVCIVQAGFKVDCEEATLLVDIVNFDDPHPELPSHHSKAVKSFSFALQSPRCDEIYVDCFKIKGS